MELELIVVISNSVLVLGTFIATLYRIKIECDQIRTVKLDVKAKECLSELRKYIKTERNSLIEMDKKELKSFIDYLEKLGKNWFNTIYNFISYWVMIYRKRYSLNHIFDNIFPIMLTMYHIYNIFLGS